MTEAEFFALVAERDEARAQVSETYQSYKNAEAKARRDVGTADYALFLSAIAVEQRAYSDAEARARSFDDRVRFVLDSLQQPKFVIVTNEDASATTGIPSRGKN